MIIYLLAVIGIVFWVSNTDMLSKIRNIIISINPIFYKLFMCPFCMGFHISWILGLIFLPFKIIIPFAFAGGISTLIVFTILSFVEKYNEKN